MKIKIIKTALIVLTFIMSINIAQAIQNKPFDIQNAKELLKEYTSAIKSGDRSLVQEFWSRESIYKKGFWESMHITKGNMSSFEQFKYFLEYYQPESEGIRKENEFYIVDFSWVPLNTEKNPNRKLDMHYYIIEEDGTYKFINPLDALTRSWKTYESRNFILHYKNDLNLNRYGSLIEELDSQYEEIVSAMGVESGCKVDYYVAPTEEICGEMLLLNPCNAYTIMSRNMVVSTKFGSRPELVETQYENK